MHNDYKFKRKKYFSHRANAKGRGIPWCFNYVTWIKIWYGSGHWCDRGPYKGQYVMSRPGDRGPYAPWNVRIVEQEINHMEFKDTPETRMKRSKAKIGNKWNVGRKIGPAHAKKISDAIKGRPFSKEHKLRLSIAATGRKLTELTKRKMSLARMGKKMSTKTKRKLREGYDKWLMEERNA